MSFKLNPRLFAELEQQAEFQAAKVAIAGGVAAVAQRLGRQVDPDYEASVDVKGPLVRVVGHAPGINPASWIEFGTGPPAPTPPYAPLRRGAQAVGLLLRPSK
jgi:hypothetical protein